MLKLKLQSFGHLMQRADSFEKTLMLEKIEGRSCTEGCRLSPVLARPVSSCCSHLARVILHRIFLFKHLCST